MSPSPTTSPPSLLRRLLIGRHPKRTLRRAAVLAATAFVVFKFVLLPVRITGGSMIPTYRDGGVNFINALAYRWSRPRRGDVVGVEFTGKHIMLFKRIIGLPGETLAIEQGVVLIDGRPLAEPYVQERAAWQLPPRQLERDEYFVIGDNRGMAQETHQFGATKAKKIAGKVLW